VDCSAHSPALPHGHPFRDFREGYWSSTTSMLEPLSGSLSYIITETFGWKEGLDKKLHNAKVFYIIISRNKKNT